MKEDEILVKRFAELSRRSFESGIYTFTDFLGLYEQDLFSKAKNLLSGVKYETYGGVEGAERVMIRFGDPEELGYVEDYPIKVLEVAPVCEKFADRLTHRDYLGSLMNLGIERTLIGDIAVCGNRAYVFVKEDIAPYITDELKRVKHTDVRVRVTEELPTTELYKTERRKIQLQGERIDAAVAKVYSISREDSASLFKKGLVFVNGALCENLSKMPKEGDVVSVRGYGRFIYRGFESETRKGKLNIIVDIYV